MEAVPKNPSSRGGGEVCDIRARSVDRALNLIELLTKSSQGLTSSELSRMLRIPKSAAHYLVYTLLSRGYLQRAIDGRHYVLGLQVASLVPVNPIHAQWRYLVTPCLRNLVQKLKLPALASVLNGAEAVIIAEVGCTTDSGEDAWVGRHIDLHCTAQGKSLIASLSERELEALLKDRKLARFTPKTITSRESLTLHLAERRRNGYTVNDEEHKLGVRAVAAPIFDRLGRTVAAISVRGRIEQVHDSRLLTVGVEIRAASLELSRQLSESLSLEPNARSVGVAESSV